jgi:hypothetical protein
VDFALNQASFGGCDLYTRPCLVCRDNGLSGTTNTSLRQACETFHLGTSSQVLLRVVYKLLDAKIENCFKTNEN